MKTATVAPSHRLSIAFPCGDSTVTIPAFADGAYGGERDQTACDLVLVDGDHSYKGELENVLHFRRLARCGEGSKYIMDDCSCRKRALPTTRAWTEAVRQGAIVPQAGPRTSRAHSGRCTSTKTLSASG